MAYEKATAELILNALWSWRLPSFPTTPPNPLYRAEIQNALQVTNKCTIAEIKLEKEPGIEAMHTPKGSEE